MHSGPRTNSTCSAKVNSARRGCCPIFSCVVNNRQFRSRARRSRMRTSANRALEADHDVGAGLRAAFVPSLRGSRLDAVLHDALGADVRGIVEPERHCALLCSATVTVLHPDARRQPVATVRPLVFALALHVVAFHSLPGGFGVGRGRLTLGRISLFERLTAPRYVGGRFRRVVVE
jgi:hypothetical protein